MTQRTSDAWARLQPIAHSGAPDLAECERFLLHEARLLDEGRFDEWLGLFTAEAWYWVPAEPDQASPRDTISLIYDDRRLLETRVRRLASPRIYLQEPAAPAQPQDRQGAARGNRCRRRHGPLKIPPAGIPP